jgi:hypothetical protein
MPSSNALRRVRADGAKVAMEMFIIDSIERPRADQFYWAQCCLSGSSTIHSPQKPMGEFAPLKMT